MGQNAGSRPILCLGKADSNTNGNQVEGKKYVLLSAFPKQRMGRAPHSVPTNYDFSQVRVSRMQIFLYVPAPKFALPPDRSYCCGYHRRAAGDFTSGPTAVPLPPHAPETPTVRNTGILWYRDFHPVRLSAGRLLTMLAGLWPSAHRPAHRKQTNLQ